MHAPAIRCAQVGERTRWTHAPVTAPIADMTVCGTNPTRFNAPAMDAPPTVISGSAVEVCLESSYELGEGAVWTTAYGNEGAFLHVDILGCTTSIHRPAVGGLVTFRLPSVVGTVVPVVGGRQLLVALAKGPAFVDVTTGAVARVGSGDLEPLLPANRCNDGKAGPDGRFYYGTMHGASVDPRPPTGSLYVMDHDGTSRQLLSGVTVSNGLAWSADEKTMYYIDTPTMNVQAFDWDAAKGAIR